jgi:LacI family transcriptional regulator
LNDDPNVSPQTRERVLKVMKRLNFHPNAAARGLAAGRTRIIGLVIPMAVSALFTDPYFPILMQGVSSACNAHDWFVMLWLAEPEQERRMIGKILHSGLMDGVIVASALMDDAVLNAMAASKMPFVLIGRHPTDDRVNYVDVDNLNSSREMVSYLMRMGYRRVATITGPHNMIAGHDRLDGYLEALRQRGVVPDPSLIVEGYFTDTGGYTAMQRLLSQAGQGDSSRAPDAVFVASDAMAVGALRALHDAGKRVPDDIAVAGYDDIPLAANTDPPLTTVRQSIYRTGAVAAETLFDIVEHPGPSPRRVILPTELVIRASTSSRN